MHWLELQVQKNIAHVSRDRIFLWAHFLHHFKKRWYLCKGPTLPCNYPRINLCCKEGFSQWFHHVFLIMCSFPSWEVLFLGSQFHKREIVFKFELTRETRYSILKHFLAMWKLLIPKFLWFNSGYSAGCVHLNSNLILPFQSCGKDTLLLLMFFHAALLLLYLQQLLNSSSYQIFHSTTHTCLNVPI